MDNLYDHGIAPLPKSEKSVRMFQNYHEQYHWPLGIAVALLLLEMFLPERKRRRSKQSATTSATAGKLAETVAILILLAMPAVAWGSPASAFREYNEGKYQDALRDYNQLLEKKKDDPRLHFNAGTAAYQSRKLDDAAKEFSSALASPDLQLQQRAYYNLGNTLYRAGQELPDAAKKQEAWENAMKQYESALKLNQQDTDAKFNQEFVQKQLEELKKQQQQQQSQSKDNSDKQQKQNQDQKDQAKNDSQKDQQKKSQDQKDQQNQQNQQDQQNQDKSQSDQNKDSQAKSKEDEKKSAEDQKKQDQAEAKKQKEDAEKKKEMAQNQASGEPKDKSSEEAKREAAMMAAGEMTPQQAQQLLDAEKDDEQVLRLAPPNKNTRQSRPFKNW